MTSVFLLSCTKEEDVTEITIDQTKNKIISYGITNPGKKDAIYSAIDHEAKIITAYLPAYYELEFMEVGIELPQGTTISPSTDELVPVFSEKPFEYTVIAADGTTAKYKLNVVIQYPDMVLNELSTINASTGAVSTAKLESIITLSGKNFLPSGSVTKLYIVDENGNKIWGSYVMDEVNSTSKSLTFTTDPKSETYIELIKDKTKQYWVQLESYGMIKKMTRHVTFK
ncbi:hypothetical protein [Flavobacterium ajazii]|uniref:hypothetical protein n=1 Tax=Flavobacterium ajazii TaxID=2692318 RepID=UPI0013D03E64|nr:hypothetical protein [Flavobacterium ajazii]